MFVAVHGSVIKNCYKLGGQRLVPLTTIFIPNMKHSLYVLSLVSGYNLNSIKTYLVNPEHPEKYMLEMHWIVINCSVLTVSVYVLSIVNLIARSWPNRSWLRCNRWQSLYINLLKFILNFSYLAERYKAYSPIELNFNIE